MGHHVGLNGEKLQVFTEEGSKQVQWDKTKGSAQGLTWYKTYFDAPEGNNPVAIRMTGMGKGMIWVNGRSIGGTGCPSSLLLENQLNPSTTFQDLSSSLHKIFLLCWRAASEAQTH
ncbi:hypothetical protein Prudu_000075 [Prunus dulcis]|uniref:Beta-galactosidase galactose-binding domain-containing protein n=1 Tax=Prunus dulcis TaxID=3755 RepID=A0A4Y1QKS3_PRUDU|nr:hypothetical protein Prudu_000075 [Prunus dulcis]